MYLSNRPNLIYYLKSMYMFKLDYYCTSTRIESFCVSSFAGSLEVLLGLETYTETARAPGECEVLLLKRSQFERMFRRKYALNTVEKLKEVLATRLCLYIYQCAQRTSASFLKYLNMRLIDASILQEVSESRHS